MDSARADLIDAWWSDLDAGRTDQLMMAERRVDVARLNQLARNRFANAGRLSNQRIEIGERDYAAGDRVMFAHNDYRLGVRNGERGTITALDPDERTVTVHVNDRTAHTSDDLHVTVPAEYLEAGDLVWGYAATVHKNQGATSDYSYLLASDALYRELGYTALSRGRIENRIWTVDNFDVDDDLEHAHTPEPDTPRDPIGELVRAMERSAAQQMAIDQAATPPNVDPDRSIDVDELIARRDAIDAALFRSAPLRVTDELTEATRRLTVAERRLTEADERDWVARSESVVEARVQLDEYAAMQARFDDWTLEHRDDLSWRRILDAEVNRALTEAVVAIEHDPPAELVAAIGHPPTGVDARADWRATAVRLALDAPADPSPAGDAPGPEGEPSEMDVS